MKTEYEAKILNINPEVIKERLLSLGGKHLADRDMRRYVYDFNPVEPNSWIRLRFDGIKAQLTIKEIQHKGITGTKELEVDVADFDTMNEILQRLGYKPRSYQENRRESYELNGVAVEIDYWPKINPYIEIEASNEAEVIEVAEKLGYKESDLNHDNTDDLYSKQGIDLSSITELKF
jgi:adenylate cyclase class 2